MVHNDAQREKDQIEGIATETPSVESEKKVSPLSTRGTRFRDEFLRRVVAWEKIPFSLDTFPYYIHERTKALLMECTASHLKQKTLSKYGGRLASSSGRILLQSIPGTGLCRERLVSALAREFQVPLLKLDSSVSPPYDFSQYCTSEGESEVESEYDTMDAEEYDEVDTKTPAPPCKKCASAKSRISSSSSKSETAERNDKDVCLLKEGDRVKYVGPTTSIEEAKNRILSSGQRGEVHEVNGDKVAVVFNICGLATKEVEKDERSTETAAQALVTWLDVKHVNHDLDAQTHDCYIAMEALCQVLECQRPIIVYFPDSLIWLSRRASPKTRNEFVGKVKKLFDQLSGRLVLICGQNKWGDRSEEIMEKFPVSLQQYIVRLKSPTNYGLKLPTNYGLKFPTNYDVCPMSKLFTNVMYMEPPEDKDLLNTFVKQIEEDWVTVISEANLSEMQKVLREQNLLCMDLEHANIDDIILSKHEVEKVVGWAVNHYLSWCHQPCFKEGQLQVPHESLKLAILRLKEQETESKEPSTSVKDLASGEYERRLVSEVVRPDDIGVKFDDVGALEDLKKELYELVILPLRRPELFSHGNLLRPCKGILLFGPPGNGKTLLAKALATEAGANFISVTAASLTSKWYGEAEKTVKALFSYASKLAPVIIFVDEIDALLGARGICEHEVTRKMKNEFMAAWDGLRSKENQRILVLGATNRPFDLDDAVIRRMPRRIYVGLPDVENRSKILKVLLAKENLESGFSFQKLAEATEGYSGSDLKNLCVAAAYGPVLELLEKESKGERSDGVPAIRPLNVNDFIRSKAKVAPSVAYNSRSIVELRKWNEQYGEGGSL